MTLQPKPHFRAWPVIISVSLAATLGLIVWAYPKIKRIEKHGPNLDSVAAVLRGDVNATAASISALFNNWSDFDRPGQIGKYQNKFPSDSQWNRFFLFRKDDPQHPLFPSDEEILLDRGKDTYVERYVRIPPALRTQDFYFYEPSGDYYWNSEYFYQGQPAKFRCSFLIHVEPAGESGTRVEIFEYQPTLWVGEYFGFSAHAILPTMLHDIRPVEATTADRTVLLAMIQGIKRAQSQGSPRQMP